jgi:hypothetical protein
MLKAVKWRRRRTHRPGEGKSVSRTTMQASYILAARIANHSYFEFRRAERSSSKEGAGYPSEGALQNPPKRQLTTMRRGPQLIISIYPSGAPHSRLRGKTSGTENPTFPEMFAFECLRRKQSNQKPTKNKLYESHNVRQEARY